MTYKGVKETSSKKTSQIPQLIQVAQKIKLNYFVSKKEFILQKNNQLFIGNLLTHEMKC